MTKLSNEEVKVLLKKHPQFKYTNAIIGLGLLAWLSAFFITPPYQDIAKYMAWVAFGVGCVYILYLRRVVANSVQ